MKNKQFKIYLTLSILLLTVMASCNKDFDTKISDQPSSDSVSVAFGKPKVILLIADGARGVSVRDAKTPVLLSMLPHAIYSWTSLTDDENPELGTSWTDLLTGVQKDKHGVVANDFSESKFGAYPSIFTRIKTATPQARIVSFASSNNFATNLTKDVDVSEISGTDEAVKGGIINSLAKDTASLIVGQFKDIDVAGAAEGYDVSKTGYKNAILKFDGAVGEILSALTSRPNFSGENWLVVVVSSNGGYYPTPPELDDKTVFSKPEANTFTIVYNPKYKTKFLGKPYLGNPYMGKGVRLNGSGDEAVKATTTENSGDFNFGDTVQFSIELKIKKFPGPDNNYRYFYPSILGKREEWSSGGPGNGWTLFLENNYWQFSIRGTERGEQVAGATLSAGSWNSIAVVCVNRIVDGAKKRFVRTFTDGRFNNEMEITDFGSINNSFPLTLGLMPGNGHREPDMIVSDVRIWKRALPDNVITQFSCDTDVSEDHPYYDYLIGYWPCTEGEGDQLIDYGASGTNFILQRDYQWDVFNDLLCGPNAATLASSVPRNIDVATQVLSWFKIPTQENWNLNGRVWLDQ